MDDLVVFTGGFALDTDRAWGRVPDFLQTRPAFRASGVRCS
ncbi:hypothetical protein [Streptomyces sp. NPDC015242]